MGKRYLLHLNVSYVAIVLFDMNVQGFNSLLLSLNLCILHNNSCWKGVLCFIFQIINYLSGLGSCVLLMMLPGAVSTCSSQPKQQRDTEHIVNKEYSEQA